MSGFFNKIFPIAQPLPRPATVREGVTRVCVSGFGISHHTGRARAIAAAIADAYPEQYETYYYFDTRGYRPDFLDSIKREIEESMVGTIDDTRKAILADHKSSPFCWLEETADKDEKEKKKMIPLGGRDRLCDWAIATFDENDSKNEPILSLCKTEPKRTWSEIKFDATTPGTTKTINTTE